ncbi:unnamed protein product [Cunninghamella blakesleeana]
MTTSVYIITFKADTTDDIIETEINKIKAAGVTIKYEYPIIKGFAVEVPNNISITSTFNSPYIDSVEADSIINIIITV